MRIAVIFLSVIAFCASVTTIGASETLRPDSLLNWLRIIELDNFELLHASSQHGYYFAVKQDSDGDVLFCVYNHSDESKEAFRRYSIEILDPAGKDLHDITSKKQSPETIHKTYTNKTRRTTTGYSPGDIYPLREHSHQTIRVRYSERFMDGAQKVLVDQLVHLPQKAR